MSKEDVRISILKYLTKNNGQTVIDISDFVNSNILTNHYHEVPMLINPMIKDDLISGRTEMYANPDRTFKEYKIIARITSKGSEFLISYRKEKTEQYYYIAITIVTLLCFFASTYSLIQNSALTKEIDSLKHRLIKVEKTINTKQKSTDLIVKKPIQKPK